MASEKRTILRTVRITPTMNKKIEEIAENEGRTVSNTINSLLMDAVKSYEERLKATTRSYSDFQEMIKSIFGEDIFKNIQTRTSTAGR